MIKLNGKKYCFSSCVKDKFQKFIIPPFTILAIIVALFIIVPIILILLVIILVPTVQLCSLYLFGNMPYYLLDEFNATSIGLLSIISFVVLYQIIININNLIDKWINTKYPPYKPKKEFKFFIRHETKKDTLFSIKDKHYTISFEFKLVLMILGAALLGAILALYIIEMILIILSMIWLYVKIELIGTHLYKDLFPVLISSLLLIIIFIWGIMSLRISFSIIWAFIIKINNKLNNWCNTKYSQVTKKECKLFVECTDE